MVSYVLGDLLEEQRSAFMALLSESAIPPETADEAFDMALKIIERDEGFALTLEVEGTEELLGVLLSAPFISDRGFPDVNTLVVWLMVFKPGSVDDGLPWSDLLQEVVTMALHRGYLRILCTAASSPAHFEFLEGDLWQIASEGSGVCWYGKGSDGALWVCTQYPDANNPSNRLAYFRLDDDDSEGSHLREVPPRSDGAEALALRLFGVKDDEQQPS